MAGESQGAQTRAEPQLKDYVKWKEFNEYREKDKAEWREAIEKTNESVNGLKESVAMIVPTLQSIDKNISEMKDSFKDVSTDLKTHDNRLDEHNLEIDRLKRNENVKVEKEKGKNQLIIAVVSGLLGSGALIAGAVNLLF
ncbi:hypothetical protein JMA_27020 [Jeotgalibacillus malaysiensis]|uniref:Uncharacterized protein n=1 Tax=Jeotgalibacillus malaysiensis TaxID=1508404 RepID=A0A0B5AVJ3_9BACL|nr:hypothetical protein [Jeotgalibacillus malaysiensis]AJD92019.1 hypothetical protein JMA_27020 [Jeotgalibacillus malaysiensis]